VSASEIFDDDAIDAFLAMGDDEPFLGAALAAEAIASSELYIQKVIRIMDLQTDGAKTAAEWRMKAKQWRDLYESAIGEAGDAFDWAELVYDPFSARERVIAQGLRA
jgi:hypothetical protein